MEAIRFNRSEQPTGISSNPHWSYYSIPAGVESGEYYPKAEADAEIARLEAEVERLRELLAYEKTSNKNNVSLYEIRCRELESELKLYNSVLAELTDLMQGIIDGDYEPDSFTLQTARNLLQGIKE